MFRIDLGAGEEIVQRANSVPGPPGSDEPADQKLLVARLQMFTDTDSDA